MLRRLARKLLRRALAAPAPPRRGLRQRALEAVATVLDARVPTNPSGNNTSAR